MKYDTERRKRGNKYDRKIGKEEMSVGNVDSWQGQANQVKVTVTMKETVKMIIGREEGRINKGLRNQSLK